jgi:hopanoid biosynthesis associated radical SAM protein HpnH
MRYPLGLVLDSAKHLAARKFNGHQKFALVLTLDPLGGCSTKCGGNSATAGGNGPAMLSLEQCLGALADCDAPIVRIRGGEPLQYPEISGLVREIVARGKHVLLCTDGSLIRRRMHLMRPETNFFWNVKLDGTEAVHDARYGRPGLFVEALDGIRAAKLAGFYVLVTTTVCPTTDAHDVAALYERLHALHVDGYSFTPAQAGKKLCKDGSTEFHSRMSSKFRELSAAVGEYNLMNSPIYLEYLRGERELDCCAWGSPVYGPRGWVAPCPVLKQGHEQSYGDLLRNTAWENYGRGLNPDCETCMCESGYETAAVIGANPQAGDGWKMLAWQFSSSLGEKRSRAPR